MNISDKVQDITQKVLQLKLQLKQIKQDNVVLTEVNQRLMAQLAAKEVEILRLTKLLPNEILEQQMASAQKLRKEPIEYAHDNKHDLDWLKQL